MHLFFFLHCLHLKRKIPSTTVEKFLASQIHFWQLISAGKKKNRCGWTQRCIFFLFSVQKLHSPPMLVRCKQANKQTECVHVLNFTVCLKASSSIGGTSSAHAFIMLWFPAMSVLFPELTQIMAFSSIHFSLSLSTSVK